jgi:hypothetical protein
MGGCCQVCGYNKCDSSLALHHINPEEKEISLGAIRSNPKNWNSIVAELRKCVLVCHNCHTEIHHGITFLPENFKMFDESYVDYKLKKDLYDLCPICKNEKFVHNKYCSLKCSGKNQSKVNWDLYDLKMMYSYMSVVDISEKIGVSDAAVHKRLKKLGLK